MAYYQVTHRRYRNVLKGRHPLFSKRGAIKHSVEKNIIKTRTKELRFNKGK